MQVTFFSIFCGNVEVGQGRLVSIIHSNNDFKYHFFSGLACGLSLHSEKEVIFVSVYHCANQKAILCIYLSNHST